MPRRAGFTGLMMERRWLELLDEFRALGGVAENVRLGEGPLGRGLFSLDPARPVALRVPTALLVEVDDMVFENGVLRVGPAAKVGARERSWLDHYQEHFGWGVGGDEVRREFEEIVRLPESLRHDLATRYHCGNRFADQGEAAVRRAFLGSRSITCGARNVVMPIIDLANHGEGATYDVGDEVALNGTFPGEVLVRYSDSDPFDYFRTWGFATARPVAFSIPLMGQLEGARLKVERAIHIDSRGPKLWVPGLKRKDDIVALEFVMLANEQYPRLSKGIFHKVLSEAGFARLDEPFDVIQHVNRMHFLELLGVVEDYDLPVARTLRTVVRHQLRALSFHYGMRQV
jgi:hypothetical protein